MTAGSVGHQGLSAAAVTTTTRRPVSRRAWARVARVAVRPDPGLPVTRQPAPVGGSASGVASSPPSPNHTRGSRCARGSSSRPTRCGNGASRSGAGRVPGPTGCGIGQGCRSWRGPGWGGLRQRRGGFQQCHLGTGHLAAADPKHPTVRPRRRQLVRRHPRQQGGCRVGRAQQEPLGQHRGQRSGQEGAATGHDQAQSGCGAVPGQGLQLVATLGPSGPGPRLLESLPAVDHQDGGSVGCRPRGAATRQGRRLTRRTVRSTSERARRCR